MANHNPVTKIRTADTNGSVRAGNPLSRRQRVKIYVLICLGIAHILISWLTPVPGYLLIDEAFYHWMTRDFAATGGFELWDGYREFPSPELSHRHMPVHFGRLVSQWPYLFPVLCLPFYLAWGLLGMYFVNAASFVGVVLLCFVVTRKISGDVDLALNSCLIFISATFAWEYSQAVWPHTTALLFTMGGFCLGVYAFYAATRKKAVLLALAGGLVIGFGPGVRMDSFLALPVLVIPFLFSRPWRPLEASASILGLVPGLLILASTNFIKFGVFSPFSYGHEHGIIVPLPIIVGLALFLIVLWVLTRPVCTDFVRRRKALIIVTVIAVFAVGAAASIGTRVSKEIINNAYVSIVDIRALPAGAQMPSLDRLPDGGLVYIGALKKSLLQSLPFMPILLLPLMAVLRGREHITEIALVSIIPITFVAHYVFAPHGFGGLCLNLRYFIPILPFVSIVAAYGIRHMQREWGLSFSLPVMAGIAAATGAAFYLLTLMPADTPARLEFPLLILPLILAGVLALTLVVGEFLTSEGSRAFRGAAYVILTIAMTWASLTAFGYDYPHHQAARRGSHETDSRTLSLVPGDSLFFSHPYLGPSLIEADRIRIAFPSTDRAKDMPRLTEFHLREGRRVFSILPPHLWQDLETRILANYRMEPVKVLPNSAILGEILPKTIADPSPP